MSKRSDKLLIEDILESIEKIKRYTKNINRQEFGGDEMRVDAVVRNFEIIGEAANRISNDLQENNSEIAWRRIIGLRNRIVHEYFGIDLDILWTIIHNYLDDLENQLSKINIDNIEE
jgi:uncharacterized protein with HEPN domain